MGLFAAAKSYQSHVILSTLAYVLVNLQSLYLLQLKRRPLGSEDQEIVVGSTLVAGESDCQARLLQLRDKNGDGKDK